MAPTGEDVVTVPLQVYLEDKIASLEGVMGVELANVRREISQAREQGTREHVEVRSEIVALTKEVQALAAADQRQAVTMRTLAKMAAIGGGCATALAAVATTVAMLLDRLG